MLSTSEDAGFYSHNRDREFRPLAEPNPKLPFSQSFPILPPRRPRRKEAVPPQDFLTDWTIINGAYGLQLGHKGEGTSPLHAFRQASHYSPAQRLQLNELCGV